ncbi:MAG: DUF4350 domain-containing protein [Acidobacteria bacterium]|nr:DUF4350 domain-containing protein [Acidobacteriota bacterium]
MSLDAPPRAHSGATAGADASDGRVLTASPRRMLRRRRGLLVLATAVVLVAIALVIIHGSATASADPLDVTNPGPSGARAVAQVLGQQGVDVIPADSLSAARAQVTAPSDTTVLVYDPKGYMTGEQRRALLGLGTDVVVVEPQLLDLDQYAPQLGLAGARSGSYPADCPVTAVQKAGTVSGTGLGYRVLPDAAAPSASPSAEIITPCLHSSGVAGLVQIADHGRTITILGLGSILQNDTIAQDGDAALALNLLGGHHRLIWYLSTFADLQQGPAPSLAELTPAWLTPLLTLFALVGVAAMVWRGRRFGPIVVENLPVVVRSSETMEGRARLYSRANARLRALDALRIGTIIRLARLTGLPRTAAVDEVIDAVATLLGRDRGEIASLLLDTLPSNDSALVQFSDQLLTLEADVAAAIAA